MPNPNPPNENPNAGRKIMNLTITELEAIFRQFLNENVPSTTVHEHIWNDFKRRVSQVSTIDAPEPPSGK